MSDTLNGPIQTASVIGYSGGLTMSEYPPGIVPPSPARTSPDRATASSPPPQKISKTQYPIGTPVLGDPTTWGQKRTADDLVKFWTTEGGMTPIAAQGIVSRVQKESGFYPMALGDHGTSFGTYQHHGDRWAALKKYASENGLDPNDGHTQDLFALQETKTDPRLQAMILKLNAARTPEEAEKIWTDRFEKPSPLTPNMPYAPTAWDEGKLAMAGQFLPQMMRDLQEGKERVAKIDRDYKPIQVQEQPKAPEVDPLKSFGSAASLFAMIAAGFSKTPAVAAMNGMAGAINAAKEHDWEQYSAQFKAWKANTDLAHQAHEQYSQDIHRALEMMTTNVSVGKTMLESYAALARDEQTLSDLRQGHLDKIAEREEHRQKHDQDMQRTAAEAQASSLLGAAQTNLDAAIKSGIPERIEQAQQGYDFAKHLYQDAKSPWGAGRAANLTAQDEAAMVSRWRLEYQEREGHPPSVDDETAYRLRLRGKEDPTVAGARKDRAQIAKERADQAKADHADRMATIAENRGMSQDERWRAIEAETERYHRETTSFKDRVQTAKERAQAGTPMTPEERESGAAQASTGMPLNQIVWGYGPSAVAERKNLRLSAINKIMNDTGMSANDAGIELANRTIEYQSGKKSSGQLTTMLGATKQAVAQLDFNTDKTKHEMAKLGSSDLSPIINAIARGEEKWTGEPAYSSLFYFMHATALESARILSGGQASIAQLHQGAMDEAEKWASINMTPASFDAVSDAMKEEGHYRIKTFEDALRSQRMGGAVTPAVTPAATPGGKASAASFPPVPSEAAAGLRKAPETAAHFDEVFGPGAAAKVLGGKAESSSTVSQQKPERIYRNGEWRDLPADEIKEGDVRSSRGDYEVLRNGTWSPP